MKIHTLLFCLLGCLLFLAPATIYPAPTDSGHGVDSTLLPDEMIGIDLDDYRGFLKNHPPLDRLYIKEHIGYFLVTPKELDSVSTAGVPILSRQKLSLTNRNGLDMSSNGAFHSFLETRDFLTSLESRFPNQARVFSIGQSIEGRELLVIKISDNVNVDEDNSEANVFIVGCHHAREWISVEVPLLFASYLLEYYENNSYVHNLVDHAQIYIMPIENPDGLEFSIHTYRLWRKNRAYNGNFSWGVDTNRNYGFMWGYDDIGSNPDPTSLVYRGPYAFSEPETTAIQEFLLEHPPAGAISYHNYSQVILVPWGYTDIYTPDHAQHRMIANTMSDLMFAVNGNRYAFGAAELMYPTNGTFEDWVYGTFTVPAFCIELPPVDVVHGGFFTPEEAINPIFWENLPALLYFVDYSIQHYIPFFSQIDKVNPQPNQKF